MKVHLASPRGFCAGVNMAITTLDLALEKFGAPLYVYHEIVHNKYVVDHFIERGVLFVEHIDEVPNNATLLFSAHGISPEVRQAAKDRNLTAIDATCPLVTKVHIEAINYARKGYTIVLIGHDGHDEVVGTMGEAPEAILLIESPEDVEKLQIADETKLAYLTQTTLSVEDTNRILEQLKKRFPTIAGPPKADICYATTNRQEAVAKLSENADLVLVLGSQNSSNSQRLAEIARELNVKAYLIDGVAEIKPEWFENVETVAVTAGASAPEIVVENCLDYLREKYNATVEVKIIREENVSFPLPKELRNFAKTSTEPIGIDKQW